MHVYWKYDNSLAVHQYVFHAFIAGWPLYSDIGKFAPYLFSERLDVMPPGWFDIYHTVPRNISIITLRNIFGIKVIDRDKKVAVCKLPGALRERNADQTSLACMHPGLLLRGTTVSKVVPNQTRRILRRMFRLPRVTVGQGEFVNM